MQVSESQLEEGVYIASKKAIASLFSSNDHRFYYCCLITTGEAHSPLLSAWSYEALEEACKSEQCVPAEVKWSYADSPFCFFGEHYFEDLKALFNERPAVSSSNNEYSIRLHAMESALGKLDSEGIFGLGEERNSIYINVEVMPPDYTNTERAVRLNPQNAIQQWLEEAAEYEIT